MSKLPNRPEPDTPFSNVLALYNQNFDILDDQYLTKLTGTMAVVQQGSGTTATFSITGSGGNWVKSGNLSPLTIAHNLGYTPLVIAAIDFGNGQRTLVPATFTQVQSVSAMYWELVTINVDSTNLYIFDLAYSNGAVSATGGGFNVRYYLLQQQAN